MCRKAWEFESPLPHHTLGNAAKKTGSPYENKRGYRIIWASVEIVSVFIFLLPGFVAAAVFYSFTAYPKPNEFGQVIQALMLTMIGQIIAGIIQLLTTAFGAQDPWPSSLAIIVPTLSAVAFALIATYLYNRDLTHKAFRLIGLTRETANPTWYSSFADNADCYVVLRLKDERRLFGWPEEWPSHPGQGHFRITEAFWLDDDNLDSRYENRREIYAIIVAVSDVETVEFIKPSDSE